MASSLGSASQPADHHPNQEMRRSRKAARCTAQLLALPQESLLFVVQCVGAHNLEAIWECSQCNPYWYNWYCQECRKVNQYLHWTFRNHFGECDQSCGCCRSEDGSWGGCSCCDALLELQATCRRMRAILNKYNGR